MSLLAAGLLSLGLAPFNYRTRAHDGPVRIICHWQRALRNFQQPPGHPRRLYANVENPGHLGYLPFRVRSSVRRKSWRRPIYLLAKRWSSTW